VACLFCQIAQGEVPATVVYHQDGVTAFLDRAPQAPTHVLVIPDQHIDGAAAVGPDHEQIVGRLVRVAAEVARQRGIAEKGYRLIINQGHDAGQTVDHIHLHLIGGRPLPTPLV
jgi:histidine triad (HIT) family protein